MQRKTDKEFCFMSVVKFEKAVTLFVEKRTHGDTSHASQFLLHALDKITRYMENNYNVTSIS
jgi:hypothetical protein